jgi:hypothetical protein
MSMAVCLLLIMVMKDANEYDKFHRQATECIVSTRRHYGKGGGSEPYASSPYVVGATLASN